MLFCFDSMYYRQIMAFDQRGKYLRDSEIKGLVTLAIRYIGNTFNTPNIPDLRYTLESAMQFTSKIQDTLTKYFLSYREIDEVVTLANAFVMAITVEIKQSATLYPFLSSKKIESVEYAENGVNLWLI